MTEIVNAKPAKRFFVSMLTRDIELKDAIMDLLDNCVDGILRQPSNKETEKPYEGFRADIVATVDEFSVSDNCGGIPRGIAIKSAFRLGRIDDERDKDLATVGMYGIGMKRALFKMGRHAYVESRYADTSYFVEIKPSWLLDDDDWDLQLQDSDTSLTDAGTRIRITDLYGPISIQFDPKRSNFLTQLRIEVESFYALILQKGFEVTINGERLTPVGLDILFPNDFQEEVIRPYAYRATIDSVSIEMFVGFYRKLATEAEIEDEKRLVRSRDNAGWTILCNDRVVLHRDKSPITGWGIGNVPKYHNQFIAIAGVVHFRSNHPLNLPLNTTKRGLDTSSPVYWHTLRFMQEGVKIFTDFTNRWKGREEETDAQFESSISKGVNEIIRSIPESAWTTIRNSEGQRFVPDLPRPARQDSSSRIAFSRVSYARCPPGRLSLPR